VFVQQTSQTEEGTHHKDFISEQQTAKVELKQIHHYFLLFLKQLDFLTLKHTFGLIY
jgi:hypothetical protein